MAVAVAGPEDAQLALIDRPAGNGGIPRRLAVRTRVRRPFANGAYYVLFARSCIAVLSDVRVETQHFQILLRVDAAFAQKMNRQYRRMRRVAASHRKPFALEIVQRMYRRIRPRDEHGGEVDVTVAHSQHEALSAEPLPGLQIGQRGVPRDIDMADDQRIDKGRIT